MMILPGFVEENIAQREDICGGVEFIKDHEVPVWKIAKLHNSGLSLKKIADNFEGLTPKEARIALFYYRHNRKKINKQIKEN